MYIVYGQVQGYDGEPAFLLRGDGHVCRQWPSKTDADNWRQFTGNQIIPALHLDVDTMREALSRQTSSQASGQSGPTTVTSTVTSILS